MDIRDEVIQFVIRTWGGKQIGKTNKIIIEDNVFKVVLKIEGYEPHEGRDHYIGEALGWYKDRWFKLVELK